MVFCATKRMVDDVVTGLQGRGYLAEGLHGEMRQPVREKVLHAFRTARIEVLVATDVAARGLDIREVSHVVNFDIPPDAECYVHRIGRTGRLGRVAGGDHIREPTRDAPAEDHSADYRRTIRREEVPTAAEVDARSNALKSACCRSWLPVGGDAIGHSSSSRPTTMIPSILRRPHWRWGQRDRRGPVSADRAVVVPPERGVYRNAWRVRAGAVGPSTQLRPPG
jgi:hypothetical protein